LARILAVVAGWSYGCYGSFDDVVQCSFGFGSHKNAWHGDFPPSYGSFHFGGFALEVVVLKGSERLILEFTFRWCG